VGLKSNNDEEFANNINNNHQSGNNKHFSTETLTVFTDDTILKAMDNKMLTALLLSDLSKAFDSINHNILLQKLDCIGMSQSSLRWFSSYLSGRLQVVRIGSTLSSLKALSHYCVSY
jgi:hypothetical protein